MSVHAATLNFRQGVEGVPQPEEQLLAIHKFLGAGLVQAGGVFDPIVTIQGIISLVVAHPFRMGGLAPLTGYEFLGYLVRHLRQRAYISYIDAGQNDPGLSVPARQREGQRHF